MGLPLKSQKGYKPGKLDIKAKQQAEKVGNGFGNAKIFKGKMTKSVGKKPNEPIGIPVLGEWGGTKGIPAWVSYDFDKDVVESMETMVFGHTGGYKMAPVKTQYNPYPEPDIEALTEGLTLEEIREMELLTGKDLLPKEYKKAATPAYNIVEGTVVDADYLEQTIKLVTKPLPLHPGDTVIYKGTVHDVVAVGKDSELQGGHCWVVLKLKEYASPQPEPKFLAVHMSSFQYNHEVGTTILYLGKKHKIDHYDGDYVHLELVDETTYATGGLVGGKHHPNLIYNEPCKAEIKEAECIPKILKGEYVDKFLMDSLKEVTDTFKVSGTLTGKMSSTTHAAANQPKKAITLDGILKAKKSLEAEFGSKQAKAALFAQTYGGSEESIKYLLQSMSKEDKWKLGGTVTGKMSSSDPAFQNIPKTGNQLPSAADMPSFKDTKGNQYYGLDAVDLIMKLPYGFHQGTKVDVGDAVTLPESMGGETYTCTSAGVLPGHEKWGNGNQLPEHPKMVKHPFCDNPQCKYHGAKVDEATTHYYDYTVKLDWDGAEPNKLQRYYATHSKKGLMMALCPSCASVVEMLGQQVYEWVPSV